MNQDKGKQAKKTDLAEKKRDRDITRHSEAIGDEQLKTRPGKENRMETKPIFDDDFPGAGRLAGKTALITGGDSGIGRAVAVAFAKEGAKVAITYLEESKDAQDTAEYIKRLDPETILAAGDVGDPDFCKTAVKRTIDAFGRLDILVNNAAEQHPQEDIQNITPDQLERTFRTNIFGMFYMVQAALKHLKEDASIINTSSISAYDGNRSLIDYASTKGAITTFTRSLALSLAGQKIRVNSVVPGPIWAPIIPSTYKGDHVERFGEDTLLGRPGQPVELAEALIFLAWDRASSFITGQAIHINGGRFRTS